MFEKEMAINFFMNLMLCFSLDTVPGKILPQLPTDVSGGLTAWAVEDILMTLKLINFEDVIRTIFSKRVNELNDDCLRVLPDIHDKFSPSKKQNGRFQTSVNPHKFSDEFD